MNKHRAFVNDAFIVIIPVWFLNDNPWEKGFSCDCKTIMTRCALSFQNVTKLSNNHSEMSKLNFNQLSHFNDWPKLCFFQQEMLFVCSVKWCKSTGVECELLLKSGLKVWLEEAYDNLSQNLVSVDPDPSSPLRLFGDQSRCPAFTAEPMRHMVKEPHPRQTDSMMQLWQRPHFSSVNHLFTSVCKLV